MLHLHRVCAWICSWVGFSLLAKEDKLYPLISMNFLSSFSYQLFVHGHMPHVDGGNILRSGCYLHCIHIKVAFMFLWLEITSKSMYLKFLYSFKWTIIMHDAYIVHLESFHIITFVPKQSRSTFNARCREQLYRIW